MKKLLILLLLLTNPVYAGQTYNPSTGTIQSLTTIGSSGASTFIGGVLNIPIYSGGGGSGLSIGTTTISGGTNTFVEYNNNGVLGEYGVTGTGTTAVLSTSPTFTTGITTPLVIGGTAASSSLTLESTSGTGSTDSIIFKTATQATSLTINSNGSVNIATPAQGLQLGGANGINYPSTDTTTDGSIAIGSQALGTLPASAAYSDVAIGYQALRNASMTTAAIKNTAVGFQAGINTTSGTLDTFVGYNAGGSTFGNSSDVCVGANSNCSSAAATAIGAGANAGGGATGATAIGINSVAGNLAFAAGDNAQGQGASDVTIGSGSTGGSNSSASIIIGSGADNNGANDITIGNLAGDFATGSGNVVVGFKAGTVLTTGSANIAIGSSVASATLNTGSNNILIGTNNGVDTQTAGASNTLNIGNLIYGTGLGTSGTAAAGSLSIGTTSAISGAGTTINGHIGYAPTNIPTVTTCGSGTLVAGSTDNGGQITGITAATACTITFSAPLPAAPACSFSSNNAITPTGVPTISGVTTAMTALTGTMTYLCK